MAKLANRDVGPVRAALTVLGLGVVLAVVIGLIYGLVTGHPAKGLGQAGAVVITIAAVAAIFAAYQSDVRRRKSRR